MSRYEVDMTDKIKREVKTPTNAMLYYEPKAPKILIIHSVNMSSCREAKLNYFNNFPKYNYGTA